jgi:hypothetical protein
MSKTPMKSGYAAAIRHDSRTEILYEEAWRQYVHEDSLVLKRTTVYLAVQGAVLVSIGALGPSLVAAGNAFWPRHGRAFGAIFPGVYILIVALLSLVGCKSWRDITNAGEQWIQLRRKVAVAIERLWGVDSVGIASIEDRWWGHEGKHDFEPFADNERLRDISLKPHGIEGFAAQLSMITTLMRLWVVIALIGCVAILWGCYELVRDSGAVFDSGGDQLLSFLKEDLRFAFHSLPKM